MTMILSSSCVLVRLSLSSGRQSFVSWNSSLGRIISNRCQSTTSTTRTATTAKPATQTQQRQSSLQEPLQQAIRGYLQQHYFYKEWKRQVHAKRLVEKQRNQRSLWKSSSATSNSDQTKDDTTQQPDTSALHTLACCSGFQSMSLPTQENDVVFLAEGVLARPKQQAYANIFTTGSSTNSQSYSLYAQPIQQQDAIDKQKLPPLIPSDITLYRLLENRIETMLYNGQQALTHWIHRVMWQPIKNVQKRLAAILPTQQITAESSVQTTIESSPLPPPPTTKPDSNPREEEKPHIILRVQNETGEIAIFTQIQIPQHTTLLLPFELDHKPASTFLQVSLVIFGALPLAYRSVKFLYDYPILKQSIVASLMGTIAYGIWSSRSVSRTNQALAIHEALLPRLVAQDEAAWIVLQEKASVRIAQAMRQELHDEQGQAQTAIHDMTHQMARQLIERWELRRHGETNLSVEQIVQRLSRVPL